MSEHKPFFKKLEDEFTAFLDLWKRRKGIALIGVLVLLLWLLFASLSFFSQIKKIENLENEKKDLIHQFDSIKGENKSLQEIVAPLLKQAAEKFPGEEINISLKKLLKILEENNPKDLQIRTATATVGVIVESDEVVNTTYIDRGGYVSFIYQDKPLITMSNTQCSARQKGGGRVVYKAVLNMDVMDSASGKPLSSLRISEYIRILLLPLPPKSKVLGGKLVCVFNSQKQIEIEIPPQIMEDERILIRNLDKLWG